MSKGQKNNPTVLIKAQEKFMKGKKQLKLNLLESEFNLFTDTAKNIGLTNLELFRDLLKTLDKK